MGVLCFACMSCPIHVNLPALVASICALQVAIQSNHNFNERVLPEEQCRTVQHLVVQITIKLSNRALCVSIPVRCARNCPACRNQTNTQLETAEVHDVAEVHFT